MTDGTRAAVRQRAQRHLIITADDFGLHAAVNRAVERAHLEGVLTAASLMMGAPATGDAVRVARAIPTLSVGLHLVVADGWASAPAEEIRGIADVEGYMDSRVLRRSFRFLRPTIVRQLRHEVRAQFAAFESTGLPLDHVNVHKHLHMHPVVMQIVLDELQDRGGRTAMRIPREPSGLAGVAGLGATLLHGWAKNAQRQVRRLGIRCNDAIFGLANTGRVDEARLLQFIAALPTGVSEIYLHPADTETPVTGTMQGYRPKDELLGLLSPAVRLALQGAALTVGGYRDAFGT